MNWIRCLHERHSSFKLVLMPQTKPLGRSQPNEDEATPALHWPSLVPVRRHTPTVPLAKLNGSSDAVGCSFDYCSTPRRLQREVANFLQRQGRYILRERVLQIAGIDYPQVLKP